MLRGGSFFVLCLLSARLSGLSIFLLRDRSCVLIRIHIFRLRAFPRLLTVGIRLSGRCFLCRCLLRRRFRLLLVLPASRILLSLRGCLRSVTHLCGIPRSEKTRKDEYDRKQQDCRPDPDLHVKSAKFLFSLPASLRTLTQPAAQYRLSVRGLLVRQAPSAIAFFIRILFIGISVRILIRILIRIIAEILIGILSRIPVGGIPVPSVGSIAAASVGRITPAAVVICAVAAGGPVFPAGAAPGIPAAVEKIRGKFLLFGAFRFSRTAAGGIAAHDPAAVVRPAVSIGLTASIGPAASIGLTASIGPAASVSLASSIGRGASPAAIAGSVEILPVAEIIVLRICVHLHAMTLSVGTCGLVCAVRIAVAAVSALRGGICRSAFSGAAVCFPQVKKLRCSACTAPETHSVQFSAVFVFPAQGHTNLFPSAASAAYLFRAAL